MSGQPLPLPVCAAVLCALFSLSQVEAQALPCAAAAAALALSALRRPAPVRLPWHVIGGMGALILGCAVFWEAVSPVSALGWSLLGLLVHSLLSSQTTPQRAITLLVGLLMMVLAAVRSPSSWVLLGPLGWTITLPWALLALANDPRKNTQNRLEAPWQIVPAGALAVLIFLALPRAHTVSPADLGPRIGPADSVNLEGVGELTPDVTPVFTARVRQGHVDPGTPLYFRALALDAFDGRTWRSSLPRTVRHPAMQITLADAPAEAVIWDVSLLAPTDNTLPSIGRVLQVASEPPGLGRDSDTNWYTAGPARPMQYAMTTLPPFGADVSAAVSTDTTSAIDRLRWTALPPGLDPRIPELAAEITGRTPLPMLKATRLRDHLRSRRFTYTWAPRDDDVEDTMAVFLFERRSGHCEYFASALAIMLRTQGIPARLVTGFAGGQYDPGQNYWTFRKLHAHAWVEVYADGGWWLLDATPGPRGTTAASSEWLEPVLTYDLQTQRSGVQHLGAQIEEWVRGSAPTANGVPWLGLGILSILCSVLFAALAVVVRRVLRTLAGESPSTATGPVAIAQRGARRHLLHQGWKIPSSLPPLAAAQWVHARSSAPEATALIELAELYYRVKYGGEDDTILADAAHALRQRIGRIGPPS